ncbi:hypothetical protein CcrColossus_gp251 [Caulobacter phage CcrColossus]|uniref:Uncharacterized protein n=1 Tax=Caulobacter phage CcrColossus TaxID=1211640 RepID=K4JSM5_9CAUD|nr:hypothetical protein CcrColossus_gp251 [Caulobacter phage CcrColossus]AFU88121.1 hypothetical protein CcrColossus_gp251 [Caulobacter phage CcrColossus]
MGRGIHTHLEVGRETQPVNEGLFEQPKEDRWVDREFVLTKCNDRLRADYRWYRTTTKESHVDCPKCLTKLSKERLKARVGGPRLRLEKSEERIFAARHGTTNAVYVDDVLVGYVAKADKQWRVYPLIPDGDQVIVSGRPLAEVGTAPIDSYGRYDREALGYKTKDDALLACEELRSSRRLKAAEEVIADRKAAEQRWEDREAKRKAEALTAAHRRRETLEALQDILATHPLTNYQRQGLVTAIEHFSIPGDDES